jgi:hypothetical protein
MTSGKNKQTLSPEQEAIRAAAILSSENSARWKFGGLSLVAFLSAFAGVALAMNGEFGYTQYNLSISITSASVITVLLYIFVYNNFLQASASKTLNRRAEELRCPDCNADFALEYMDKTERVIFSTPRSERSVSWEASSEEGNNHPISRCNNSHLGRRPD